MATGAIGKPASPIRAATCTAYLFDLMGRTTQEKDAFNASVNSGNPSGAWNRITYYSWYSAQHVQMTAVQLGSGIAQDTEYVYGVGSGSGSTIFSNNLLARVEYPYPTAAAPGLTPSQWQAFAYDDSGEETQTTDRNGDVHGYNHDVLGRETADIVTTLGSGVDGSVRRLGYSFNTQGLPFQQTSYSDTAGTTIVNQVQDVYNGLGQLTGQYQAHSGAVNRSTSPEVQYAYNEMGGGADNSRLISSTYPNGRVLDYNYNSGIDTAISRLSNEADAAGSGAGTDEAYTYLGLGNVVQRTDGNGVDLSYIQQAGDTSYINDGGDRYTGLDRFGRVIDQYWSPASTPTSPTDRFQLAYDENGNVLYKNNLLSSANSELYHVNSTTSGDNQTGYDPLSRLASFSRGTLSASGHNGSSGLGSFDTVGTVVHGQSWTLDDEGNWSSFTSDGTTQTRTNNTDNQITSISGATTPTYNNNGDTTKDERGYTFTFDPWDRPIVTKNAGGTTIATFSYDANGWRIADSTAGEDRYYNIQWQEIEDRNSSGVTTNQYVWSADGNIQHLVLRDDVATGASNFGTTTSGLHRRLYYQQDANGNVTALTDASGAVKERFLYDPYGAQTVLTPSWGATTDSFANVIGFQAGRVETATGLLNFRHREYSTSLGRWLQEDPAGYADGTDLYGAFLDSPVTRADPLGTTVVFACKDRSERENVIKEMNGYAESVSVPTPQHTFNAKNIYFSLASTGGTTQPTTQPGSSLESQILSGMLRSSRLFVVLNSSFDNLKLHVSAREAVVSQARAFAKNPIGFGNDEAPPQDLNGLKDIVNNPSKYTYGCLLAAKFAIFSGAASVNAEWAAGVVKQGGLGGLSITKPVSDKYDFVPGDLAARGFIPFPPTFPFESLAAYGIL